MLFSREAKVGKRSSCVMTSVEFSVRFVERVIIRARMFGKEVFENVKVSFNNIIKHYPTIRVVVV